MIERTHTPLRKEVSLVTVSSMAIAIVWDRFVFSPRLARCNPFQSIITMTHPRKGGSPMTETVSKGKAISLEYTLKLENNDVLDTNVGKDPLTYTQGANQIIPGVERAVEGLTVGQAKHVVVAPLDGYGDRNPNAVQEVSKGKVPKDIQVGMRLHGKEAAGHDVRPIVAEINDETVLLDFNHPLAGKTLFFDVKVVDIR
jgi:FKBP-type peptidyl-prolyl cis-trans isomerase SlyD